MNPELEQLKLAHQATLAELERTRAELAQMTAERNGYKSAYDIMGPELGYLRGYTAPVVRSTVDPSRLGKPSIFVVTLPKSGTVFIGNTIKQSLDYDFTSVMVTSTFPKNIVWQSMVVDFLRGGMVSVSHMQPDRDNFWALANNGLLKVVLHSRDPRAAWWSWYNFLRARPDEHVHLAAAQTESFLTRPEPDQVDSLIRTFFRDAVHWLNGWMQLLKAQPKMEYLLMTHEELAGDGPGYFRKVFDFYGIEAEPMLVAKDAGTHFRKGDNDEWRSGVTVEQAERMSRMMSDELCEFYGFRR